jgi:hypothetical protein
MRWDTDVEKTHEMLTIPPPMSGPLPDYRLKRLHGIKGLVA